MTLQVLTYSRNMARAPIILGAYELDRATLTPIHRSISLSHPWWHMVLTQWAMAHFARSPLAM